MPILAPVSGWIGVQVPSTFAPLGPGNLSDTSATSANDPGTSISKLSPFLNRVFATAGLPSLMVTSDPAARVTVHDDHFELFDDRVWVEIATGASLG